MYCNTHVGHFFLNNRLNLPFLFIADYIMVGRASILLRGLAHMLQQSRSVAKSWKPLAERVLNEDL